MMMDGVLAMKDPDALKAAIRKAAERKPTSDELLAQRVSFVFASVSEKSGVTKEKVRKALLEQSQGPETV